ncbi:MAG: hypothetical protein RIG77_25730 [Cyclobacteriaceae bacterium]
MIEDFLSGALSPDEEREFRKRLDAEAHLAKAYSFRSKIALYWNEALSYETTMKQVKEVVDKERNRKRKLATYLYAASVVILIGVVVFFAQQPKRNAIDGQFAASEKDTSTNSISPLSTNEQPEKGSQFAVPLEFLLNDTLVIHRTTDVESVEKIRILRLSDHGVVGRYLLKEGADSLLIPLKGMQPGSYQWIKAGTPSSGDFIIRENSMPNKN